MEALRETVGIREAKNGLSALTARVNETGEPLTVLKNNKPWVVIYPADPESARRRAKLDTLQRLTAKIEQGVGDEPVWDSAVSDKDLLGAERMRRFG